MEKPTQHSPETNKPGAEIPREFTAEMQREFKRFDLRNLFSALVDAFNLQRGLVATIWQLLKNNGQVSREYLYRGRLKFIPPFRLLLLSTTLVLLVVNIGEIQNQFNEGLQPGLQESALNESEKQSAAEALNALMAKYFNLVLWIYIPIAALVTYWFFKKKSGYNYAENTIFHTYQMVVVNFISLSYPLLKSLPIGLVSLIQMGLSFLVFLFGIKNFFEISWAQVLKRGLPAFVLIVIFYLLLISLGSSLYLAYSMP